MRNKHKIHEDLEKLLTQLIQFSSMQEFLNITEQHPELFGEEAEKVIAMMLKEFEDRNNTESVISLKKIRNMLNAVGTVFKELLSIFDTDIKQAKSAEGKFLKTNNPEYLEKAVYYWERVLEHPEFAKANNNVKILVYGDSAVTYFRRYNSIGNINNLNCAILNIKKEIEINNQSNPLTLNNLGDFLLARYHLWGGMEDLENAISLCKQAVSLLTPMDHFYPLFLASLGSKLGIRYSIYKKCKDLEDATKACEKAIELTPEESPDYPQFLSDLARILSYQNKE